MHEMKKCANCKREIHAQAVKCKYCGTHSDYTGERKKKWKKTTALLLSIVPGLGHVYKQKIFAGVVWFICVMVGYKFLLLPGTLLHILCAIMAYRGNEYH